jgi:hypothetical protein
MANLLINSLRIAVRPEVSWGDDTHAETNGLRRDDNGWIAGRSEKS